MDQGNCTSLSPSGVEGAQEFSPYSTEQKRGWAKKNAAANATMLTKFLGYEVSSRLPFVLLQAAADVIKSIRNRNRLKARICLRADHYVNTMKVLATAILHYDLAANLVAVRDRQTGDLSRCENSLFADLLGMPPRTVDNCIYSLKRSGLYLSFEQREEREQESGVVYRGVASIKRLNMVLFDMLGLGQFVSVQRAKAKERVQVLKRQSTPAETALAQYRQCDDKVRERRNQQRDAAKTKRLAALSVVQSQNRTADVLAAMEAGLSYEDIKRQYHHPDPLDDIPY